jgi:uncharacterized membrane protein (DUF485 family)
LKRITAKELDRFSQRLEKATERSYHEREELKHFTHRVSLILLLAVAVLVLLMLTFSPGLVETAVNPVVQHVSEGIQAAKPTVKHAVNAAKSLAPVVQQVAASVGDMLPK